MIHLVKISNFSALLLILLIAFPASSTITRYFGEGGVIPDNCYPQHCDLPTLDAFSNSILIEERRRINHLSITIEMNTGDSSDYMDFRLIGPNGSAGLTNIRPCLGDFEVKTFSFKDDAINGAITPEEHCNYEYFPSGEYKPVTSFENLFYNKPAFGEWTLYIFDGWSAGEGEVFEWYMDVKTVNAPSNLLIVLFYLIIGIALRIYPNLRRL